jgi:branched-chain amino acid transport system permease protein
MSVPITPAMVAQVVVSGLLAGALYAMVALGLALIFGVMRVINVAHGTFLTIGAYTTFWWFRLLGLNPYLSLLVAMPLMFLLGMVFQRTMVRRVVNAPEPPRCPDLRVDRARERAPAHRLRPPLGGVPDRRSWRAASRPRSPEWSLGFAVAITALAYWFLQTTASARRSAPPSSPEVAMDSGQCGSVHSSPGLASSPRRAAAWWR